MKSIHKYPLEITDEQEILMPKWATPLSVQMQNGQPCIWTLVNTNEPLVKANVRIIGTGHELPDNFYVGKEHHLFLGTFQTGSFVGHVFITGSFTHQS